MRSIRLRSKSDIVYYLALFFIMSLIPVIINVPYITTVMAFSLIYIVLALSYNLVLGYAGLFSLAHAAFFAVGAYTSALLSVDFKVQFPLSILTAGVSSAIVAYAMVLIALRTEQHSFGLVTLAFSSILALIYKNAVEITRGPMGIPGIPRPFLALLSFKVYFFTDIQCYYLMLIITFLCIWFLRKLCGSRIGRALIALRENIVLAETVGINSKNYLILAFVTGAFFAGISGSLYAHYVRFINPDCFSMSLTTMALTITLIGGLGGFKGVLIAAFALFLIPEALRFSPEWRDIIFGVVLMIFVRYLSEGIEEGFKSLVKKLKEVA